MRKRLLKTMLLLCALIVGSGTMWGQSWTRVTSIQTLLGGGTFIMGYEATAKSGVIVPLRSADCGATTTANGVLNTGATSGKSTSGTIDMSTVTSTSDYEIYITASSTSGYINIQRTNNSGNYYGASSGGSSKNTARLYSSGNSNETNLLPEWASETNNQFKLSANVSGQYKYLKYNTGSPRFCFYNSAGEKIVFYKKEAASTTPSFSADNVNIAYSAEGGSISYTVNNPVTGGTVSAVVTSGNWLTLGQETSSPISFTCTANETTAARTATVRLTYTYNTNETVTKDVTVTQAGAPYTTIPALFNAATNTEQTVSVTFGNWVVSGVSTNGKNVFVTDNSGNGFVIYSSSDMSGTYSAGKVLSGTVSCGLKLYNGFAELLNVSGLTINDGGTVSSANVTMDNLAGVNTGALVSYDGLTCSVDNSGNTTKYYLSDGTTTIQVYNALYAFYALENGKTYNITGVYQQYNSTKEILPRSAADIVDVANPTISTSPATANAFTYVSGSGPSAAQTFEVTGENLTSGITASITAGDSYYEVSSDNSTYSSTVNNVASGDNVYVRLKAGLAKGSYNGTLTLSSTDAENVVVSLSGSVTGQTYAINLNQPQNAGGSTISADKAAAEAGDEVTLTATPATGYSFYAWTVLDGNADEVTVTNNKFTMPASAVEVEGSFIQNNYAITVASASNGTVAVTGNPATAHYGDNVSFTATPSTDYQVKSCAVTETNGEGTVTVTENNGTYSFSMPAYPVTITVEFEEIPETYNGQGTFCKISSLDDLEDGGYYVLYGEANNDYKYAMNNTCSNGKMGGTSVTFTGDNIVNPSISIVWKLEKRVVSNNTYWDLYNEDAEKYCYISKDNTSGFAMGADPENNYYSVSVDKGVFSFVGQYGSRMISIYTTDFRCYTSSNALPLYLYKLMPPSADPAITVANSTVVVPATGGTDNLAITLSNMTVTGANDFSIQYYDENEDAISAPAWMNNVSVTASGDDYVISYTIAQNDDADRTARFKVQATVNNQPVESNLVTFTQVRYVAPVTYTLVNSITPGKTYIIASGTDGSVKAMGEQGGNNRAAVSVEATTVVNTTSISVTNEDVYEFVVYGPDASGYYTLYDKTNSKYLYAIANSNYLKTQETNKNSGKWTISFGENSEAIITAPNVVKDNDARVMRYNSDNTLFSCYLSGQDNIYLYEKDGDAAETTTASVTLNGYGYATYANAKTLDFLDNEDASYSAWQITGISGETITFEQVTETVVPATGLLLKGAASTSVNLNLLPVGGADLSTSNMLVGTTEATDFAQDAIYGLAGDTFKKNRAGTFPANKAYIPASSVGAVRSFTFVFVDPTTGITETRNVSAEEFGEVFNLAGQRMSKPQKGVNIINGKKVLVK